MRRQVLTAAGVVWALGLLAGSELRVQAQAPPEGRNNGQFDGQPDGQQPSARDRARLLMQKGRALDQKGDLAAALQLFRQAAALDPENAAVLSEVGAAALRGKDLALAESATLKAIELASDARAIAAAQYNLGRIYEEKADRPKAIAAYLDSLRSNPTPEARVHLEPLVPAGPQPLAVKPMTRVASYEAFCQQARATSCPDKSSQIDDARFGCEVSVRGPAKPPYRDVQLWLTSCQDGSDSQTSYTLAVHLAQGWFIAANVLTGANRQREMTEQRLQELTLRPAATAARAPVLVWRSLESTVSYDRSQSRETTIELEQLVLASVGPSGIPAYTEPVRLGTATKSSLTADDTDGKSSASRRAELQYKLLPDGQLELTPAAKQTKLDLMIVDEELVKNLGRQRLPFP